MHIATENELLADVKHHLPETDKALIFAPHPDDEVFGCGGAIAKLRATGTAVTVHILTDGSLGGSNTDNHLAQRRAHESREALAILDVVDVVFWDLPDRKLFYGEPLIERLLSVLHSEKPDLVFLPAPTELHPDHQSLSLLGREALRRSEKICNIIFYEISAPLPRPNLLIDISAEEDRKLKAMECFHSQLEQQPYISRIQGLNRFRAYHLGNSCKSAEAYHLCTVSELRRELPQSTEIALQRHRQGFAFSTEDLPLVSIVIRSIDRPSLTQTLASLTLQTYPHMEIIIVNAKGGKHSELNNNCGGFPLRLINQNGMQLPRSKAANTGLAACRGKYIGLLDDDDTLEPDHIQRLTDCLQSCSTGFAAYAAVQVADRSHLEPHDQPVFNTPHIDFTRLLMGNVLPVHAVLFPASVLQEGTGFDEELTLYEDWDFWLQISKILTFKFVDNISATYFTGGGSAVGAGTGIDETLQQRAAVILYNKWLPQLTAEDLYSLTQRYLQTESFLNGVQCDLNQLQSDFGDQARQLSAKEQRIKAIYASKSWMTTKPLRILGNGIILLRQSLRNKKEGRRPGLQPTDTLQERGWRKIFDRISIIISELTPDADVRTDKAKNSRHDYTEWIKQYDTLTDHDRKRILSRINNFGNRPLISIVMPVFAPPLEFLQEAINSVRSQLYSNWELCIADDASPDPEVRKLLERYAEEDERIKVVMRAENGHISKASNSALELVTGDYIALLDQDDLLAEHALFWVVNEINLHPEVMLIYSDEDKLDRHGRRCDPYFKCDWNPDLFLSHNLFSHLGIYSAEMVKNIGGFRSGFEGAQDHDLVLRCLDHVDEQQIRHIPRILYHWRTLPGSTALHPEAKDYAIPAGIKAINDYLDRNAKDATCNPTPSGYRVKYNIPETSPLVSLIIPTRNMLGLLRSCIDSIERNNHYPNYEIIIIDNDSDDPETLSYLEIMAEKQHIRVIRDRRPFNYSALNNAAVKTAAGEIIGLLNNDIEVISPDWMQELVSHACRPEVGAVGARLLYPDDKIQHAGVILGLGGVAGHSHKYLPRRQPGYLGRAISLQSFSAVTGACLFVRKKLYEEVGGLNETDLKIAFNDTDFCLKLMAKGYRNVWTPYAELYHHESASRGSDDNPEQTKRFHREIFYMMGHWKEIINHDPSYNPNLTLDYEDFSLAWPPRVPPP